MKTKEELSAMSLAELRNLGKELGIKAANLFKEEVLIRKILELQETETEEVEVVEEAEVVEGIEDPVVEEQTVDLVKEDRHGNPLEPGYEVAANINGKWYDGVVDGFKVLDGESYIYITLTKFAKQKMFLQHEVEFKKEGSPKPKPVDVKKLTDLDSADPADLNAETPAPTTKKGRKEKVVKEKVVKEKAVKPEGGTQRKEPVPGTKSAQILEALRSGKTRSAIAKELGVQYPFVFTIEKKYM